jgi:hypothetical protein
MLLKNNIEEYAMSQTSVKLVVTDIKRIKTPYDDTLESDYLTKARTYVAAVRLADVPAELKNWRKVNVRDPLMTSGVARGIASSLSEDPQAFYFKNRGLTIIADDLSFPKGKEGYVELIFGDAELNGLLDGGHTYTAIRNYLEELDSEKLSELDGHVRFEIIVGLKSQEDIVAVVDARNTSTQVKSESLQELAGFFEPIKNAIKNKPYANNVAYKETELAEDGSRKTIDVKDILSYLVCFEAERFPLDSKDQPVMAYSFKTGIVKQFKDEERRDQLEKYIPLLPDILELRDLIYEELPAAYNAAEGRFGKLTGIGMLHSGKTIILPFSGKRSQYQIPAPFIYPVLAAFRSLIKVENGKAVWIQDPRSAWERQKGNLASSIGEAAKKHQNPNRMGKEKSLWETCYRDLLVARLTGNLGQ